MRFFLAAKRTFCVITLYALKIRALSFEARFVANLDDYKCVVCCKRVYSCGETIKKHAVPFFLSTTVYTEISLTLVVASTSHINCKQLYILYAIPLALPKKLLNDIDIEWCNLADTQKLLSSI